MSSKTAKNKKKTVQSDKESVKKWQKRHPIENWAYKMIKRAGLFGLFMYDYHPLNINYDNLPRRKRDLLSRTASYNLPKYDLEVTLPVDDELVWSSDIVLKNLKGRRVFHKLTHERVREILVEQTYLSHKPTFKKPFHILWWYRLFFGVIFMLIGFISIYVLAIFIFNFKIASIAFGLFGVYTYSKMSQFFEGYRQMLKK